jgi:hypothetical protein
MSNEERRLAGLSRVANMFGLAAAAVIMITGVGSWITADFWNPVPVVAASAASGVLTGLWIYARWRRIFAGILCGVVVAGATGLLALVVFIARWDTS